MTSILFAGYAQVHYVSFKPIFERLRARTDLQIEFTGGFRTATEDGYEFSLDGFYDPFGIPAEQVIPFEKAQEKAYDIHVSSHLSDLLSPASAGATVQLFHGVSFKNCAVTPKAQKYDYLFVAGPYMRRRFIELDLFHPSDPRLVMTGFAKVDRLVDGTLDRDVILRGLGLDPARRTVIFAPTGHKHNALEVHGQQAIEAILAEGKYNLLVKPHDHPKNTEFDWRSILAAYEGDGVRAIWDADITPYLFASDLLITDASSVSNEFSLLDRPIVFLDVPKLLKKLRKSGVPLDLHTWGRKGGVLLEDTTNLGATIEGLLEGDLDRGSDWRRGLTRDIFHAPGTATDRCVEQFEQIIAGKDPAANPIPLEARS